MTAVSLFAGVGGFDLALEGAGVEVVAAVEIDDNARGVLAHKFPNTRLFTDVCEVTGEQLRESGFIPEHGVIVGGFPCQDLSVAGKRAGLAGGRSGLFWEIVRLIDELQPAWFILENVPGLLSSNSGRDMGTVIGALADRGYGIAWRVLDAQNFGVPQRRRRVFIVGRLGDDGRTPFEVLAVGEGLRGDSAASSQTGEAAAGETGAGAAGGASWWDGGQVSQTLDTVIAKQQAMPEKSRFPAVLVPTIMQAAMETVVRRLTPVECERLQGFPDDHTVERFDFKKQQVVAQADSARYKQMGNAVAVPVVAWIAQRLVTAHANALPDMEEGAA